MSAAAQLRGWREARVSDERAAFAGQITDLPVVELLRTIFTGKKTGLARFETNLGTATVWFRDGSLVDADMGRFHMGDAVRRLMSTDAGSFEVEFKPVTRRRLIQETTSELLDQGDAAIRVTQGSQPPGHRPKLTLPASAEPAKRGPRARTRAAAGWKPTAGGSGKDGGGGAASPDMLRRLEALRRAADRQQPRAEVLSSTSALGTPTPADVSRSTGETPQAGLEALNRLAQKAATVQEQPGEPDDLDQTVAVPQPVVPTAPVDAEPKTEVIDTSARPASAKAPRGIGRVASARPSPGLGSLAPFGGFACLVLARSVFSLHPSCWWRCC